jgi:hypothetical protein
MTVLVTGLLALAPVRDVSAQRAGGDPPTAEAPAAESAELLPLDVPAMQMELTRLAEICNKLQLKDEAELCKRWLPAERPDQYVFYLPVGAQPESSTDRNQAAWVKHFETARRRHAEHWFQAARQAAQKGEELQAYRMLWRTLRENALHPEATRILGRLATSCTSRPQIRRSTSKHPVYGWPGNSYSRVESPHFYLTSRATTPETIALATKLEEFYALWTQFFYPLWAPPGLLNAKFDGRSGQFDSQRQIKIVFLRDRADYVETLGIKEQNIGISVGYYDPHSQTSYFFPDEGLQATFFHELTHQLLAEATRLNPVADAGSQHSFWLLEGIALYMESFWRADNFWTLGGWESPRLQTARYRGLRDGYWQPWSEFDQGNLSQWKVDANIARLYSQAAGITHATLDDDDTRATKSVRHEKLLQALISIYQGTPDTSAILQVLGEDKAQENYEQWLTVTDSQIADLRAERPLQELVLAASELSADSWERVTEQSQLQWLDLSFANATTASLEGLSRLRLLERLSVEGTAIDGRILKTIRGLGQLNELDLTGCNIQDEDLASLARHPQLKTLWLGKTRVTDHCLETLATIPNLTFVDFQGTAITSSAWTDFVKRHPRFAPPR